jgi:hypothetical protein
MAEALNGIVTVRNWDRSVPVVRFICLESYIWLDQDSSLFSPNVSPAAVLAVPLAA